MLGLHVAEHEHDRGRQIPLDFGAEFFQNQTVEQRQLFGTSP
jgi:hypothetical protein